MIVNVSGDKIKSVIKDSTITLNKNRPVNESDLTKVIEKGIHKINVEGCELIHCLPTIIVWITAKRLRIREIFLVRRFR